MKSPCGLGVGVGEAGRVAVAAAEAVSAAIVADAAAVGAPVDTAVGCCPRPLSTTMSSRVASATKPTNAPAATAPRPRLNTGSWLGKARACRAARRPGLADNPFRGTRYRFDPAASEREHGSFLVFAKDSP